MPLDVEVRDDGKLVWFRFSGTVTEEDVTESYRRRATPQALPSRAVVVNDYTDVHNLTVTAAGIRSLAEMSLHLSSEVLDLIVVEVHPLPVSYGLARMKIIHEEPTGWTFGIFRRREEAQEWLKSLGILFRFDDQEVA